MNKHEIEKAIEAFKINLELTKEELDLPIPEGEEEHVNEWITFQELAISALTQQLHNGWIQVTEQMPEWEQDVLLSTRSLDIYTGFKANEEGMFYCDGEGYVEMKNVLAWQPLPHPYKEVSE